MAQAPLFTVYDRSELIMDADFNDMSIPVVSSEPIGNYYSPTMQDPGVLIAEPVQTTTQRTVQVAPTGSCSSCGTGGAVDVVSMGGAQPSNLSSDTRIDAGISIGWRELLIILIVAAAARYFELI